MGAAYAIIEQGMIARIIEAKPEEFGYIWKKPPGFPNTGSARRETELRLADTRENLLRLNGYLP